MWARIISVGTGVISSEVKANYRIFLGNDTDRLAKNGENIKEICRLHEIFASRYPNFRCSLPDRRLRKGLFINIGNLVRAAKGLPLISIANYGWN